MSIVELNVKQLADQALTAMHKADGAAAAMWAAEQTWRRLAADELRLDLLGIAAEAPPGRVAGFSFTAETEYLGDGVSALCASLKIRISERRGVWAWLAEQLEDYFDPEDTACEINAAPEVYAYLFGAAEPEHGGRMTVQELLDWKVIA